jgi:GNAT superfamily N-acetyltransferase
MNEYEIRKANIKDLKQIQILINKLCKKEFDEFDNTINPIFATTKQGNSYLTKRIKDNSNSFCLVVVNNDKIVGYFVGGINMVEEYRTINKIGEGETMFIEDEYRGKGIGTKFLRLFEKWCKDKKINRMRLVASSRNIQAINLYKKEGFEIYDITLEKLI